MGTFDRAGCRGEAVAANSGVNLGKLICQVIGPPDLLWPWGRIKGWPKPLCLSTLDGMPAQ